MKSWLDASSIASDHPFPKDKLDRSNIAYNGSWRAGRGRGARVSRPQFMATFHNVCRPLEREFSWRQTSFPRHRCHCRESEWTGNREECKSILENKSGSHIFPITASNFQWDGKDSKGWKRVSDKRDAPSLPSLSNTFPCLLQSNLSASTVDRISWWLWRKIFCCLNFALYLGHKFLKFINDFWKTL